MMSNLPMTLRQRVWEREGGEQTVPCVNIQMGKQRGKMCKESGQDREGEREPEHIKKPGGAMIEQEGNKRYKRCEIDWIDYYLGIASSYHQQSKILQDICGKRCFFFISFLSESVYLNFQSNVKAWLVNETFKCAVKPISFQMVTPLLTIPLTHFSAGGFTFLLGVFWLDILLGCAPVFPSDWPSLMSRACLSPCPAPRPPPRPPPRPRWFGCLREVWGFAAYRKTKQQEK